MRRHGPRSTAYPVGGDADGLDPGARRDAERAAEDEPLAAQEGGEDAGAVAAHLGERAVGVAVVHEPLGLGRERPHGVVGRETGAHDADHPVGADARVPVGEPLHLGGGELERPLEVGHEDEVVLGAVALGEARHAGHSPVCRPAGLAGSTGPLLPLAVTGVVGDPSGVHPGVLDRGRRRREEVLLVGQSVVDPELTQDPLVLGTHSRQQHRDAAALEPRDRVGEHRRSRGVDDGDARHAEHHHAHIAHLGELEEEVVGGAEEDRPVDAVGDDVLVEQRELLVGVVTLVERHLLEPGRARRLPQHEEAGHDESEEHRHDEVEQDRCGGRADQHDGITPRGAQQGAQARDPDHLHRGRDEDPGEGRRAGSSPPSGRRRAR